MKKIKEVIVLFVLLGFCASSGCGYGVNQEIKEKLGVYIWGELADTADPLVAAVDDMRVLDATKVARTSISPYWDPRGVNAGESQFWPIYDKMHRPDYWTFFNSFPVVMITAYDAASFPAKYRLPYKDDDEKMVLLGNVRQEFRHFAFNLACEIPGGTFIISNWEAENDVYVHAEANWNRYLEYVQARLNGIAAGRNDAKRANCHGKIYTAFEFANIKALGGQWDADTNRPSGITFAPWLKNLDFLSYSSWASIQVYGARELRASFTEAIRSIKQYAHDNRITDKLIIGEFGELWDISPTENNRLAAIVDVAMQKGVAYMFNWVAYEQPAQGISQHFGKFFQNRELTPQGSRFKQWLDSNVLLYGTPCVIKENQESCATTIYYAVLGSDEQFYIWVNGDEAWVSAPVSGRGELILTLRKNQPAYVRVYYWTGGCQWCGAHPDIAALDLVAASGGHPDVSGPDLSAAHHD